MVNYQLGKVYKIECNETGLIYVGSTCEPTLARRLAKHVSSYKRYLKVKKEYITSYKIIENGNYDISLLEKFPCASKEELHARERYWICKLNCVNKRIECRTRQEYRNETKNHIKYYYDNIEKIRKREGKIIICDCGVKHRHHDKARHLRSMYHQEYVKNRKWHIMLKGFELIKKLDSYFAK